MKQKPVYTQRVLPKGKEGGTDSRWLGLEIGIEVALHQDAGNGGIKVFYLTTRWDGGGKRGYVVYCVISG